MIDEITDFEFDEVLFSQNHIHDLEIKPHDKLLTAAQFKTAIYEIGLECIGAAEPRETDPKSQFTQHRIEVCNELKASQRKAWAKACGVEI